MVYGAMMLMLRGVHSGARTRDLAHIVLDPNLVGQK
jgi:hypothetical protein